MNKEYHLLNNKKDRFIEITVLLCATHTVLLAHTQGGEAYMCVLALIILTHSQYSRALT